MINKYIIHNIIIYYLFIYYLYISSFYKLAIGLNIFSYLFSSRHAGDHMIYSVYGGLTRHDFSTHPRAEIVAMRLLFLRMQATDRGLIPRMRFYSLRETSLRSCVRRPSVRPHQPIDGSSNIGRRTT